MREFDKFEDAFDSVDVSEGGRVLTLQQFKNLKCNTPVNWDLPENKIPFDWTKRLPNGRINKRGIRR